MDERNVLRRADDRQAKLAEELVGVEPARHRVDRHRPPELRSVSGGIVRVGQAVIEGAGIEPCLLVAMFVAERIADSAAPDIEQLARYRSGDHPLFKIGRASWRERVSTYG